LALRGALPPTIGAISTYSLQFLIILSIFAMIFNPNCIDRAKAQTRTANTKKKKKKKKKGKKKKDKPKGMGE
jgi:hypothetical protein